MFVLTSSKNEVAVAATEYAYLYVRFLFVVKVAVTIMSIIRFLY